MRRRTVRMLLAGCGTILIVAAGTGLWWRAAERRAAMLTIDPDRLLGDPRLAATALAAGRGVFARACAGCHGADGRGRARDGMPSLRDADHLYGDGDVASIEEIVRHGIRSGDSRGWHLAAMPAYAHPIPYAAEPIPPLTPTALLDATDYVLSLSGRQRDVAAARRGAELFQGRAGCWDCHGRDGRGDRGIGAPDLTDDVWLYGGSARAIAHSIGEGRAGVSPAFAGRLTPYEIRVVAAFVAGWPHGARR